MDTTLRDQAKLSIGTQRETRLVVLAIEEEGVPWFYDIINFLELGIYLDGIDKKKRHSVRMMVMQYILYKGHLYRKSYNRYTFVV